MVTPDAMTAQGPTPEPRVARSFPEIADALEAVARVALPRAVPASAAADVAMPDLPTEVVEGCRAAIARIDGAERSRIGVTSALPGEGRSTIAFGLAALLARDHCRRTLLLELECERPVLADRYGVAGRPGLAELVRDDAGPDDCVHQLEENLFLLPAGRGNPSSERGVAANADDVLSAVEHRFDVIVADLPALGGEGAGLLVAPLFPALLLVIRAGATPLTRVRRAVASVSTPTAVVLNGTVTALPAWVRRVVGDPA